MSGHRKTANRVSGIRRGAALLGALALSAAFSTGTALAQSARMYSATAVSQIPGQPERSGKITKSGTSVRLEYTRGGQDIVQIVLPTKGLMYFLDPTTKTYSEIKGQPVPASAITGYKSPCPPTPGARCQKIGEAVSSGIKAERWLIATPSQSGQPARPIAILWDPTRRHALSEDFPDGSKMRMRFREMVDVAGRATERWDVSITRKDQQPINGEWWFDPDLRVVVRQIIPGGESRRLDNLVVGPVDETLFSVPQGWKKIEPPAPAATGNAPANPAPKPAPQPAGD